MRCRSLLLALALGASVGCRSHDAPAPAASAVVSEAPAPKELLAELTLGNPKEAWRRLRLLGGDAAQALPSSLAVLLATSLSLPPTAAGSLDEGLPMVGALLSRSDSSEPDAVLGMHVVSGSELVASLTLGDGAKFRKLQLEPRLVRLLPAPGAPDFDGALAVSGNYLLLATRVEALSAAGRFVAEALPRRAQSEPLLRLRAAEPVLAGTLGRVLRQAWQAQHAALAARDREERSAKGRAPDFADPAVLLGGIDGTVESWLGVLESSRELTLEVAPEAERLRAELSLAPAPGGAAALLFGDLAVGSVSPLLALPAGTRAALLMRGADKDGGIHEGFGASMTQLLGERLEPEEAKRLLSAFDSLARAQHGAVVVGWVSEPAAAAIATCEVTDGPAFSSALGDVLALVDLPPIRDWLAATVGKPSLLVGKPTRGVHTARLRFNRASARATLPIPSELWLEWEVRDGVAYLSVSRSAQVGLELLSGQARLSASNWLAQTQKSWGEQAAVGVYADARLLFPDRPDDAPILLSFGKKADRIVVSLEAAPAALRALSGVLR